MEKAMMKSWISNVFWGSNSRNISPCSGVVFATKEWLLLYQLAEILTAVTMWMHLMQICGQVCANILLESTSFSRMIAPVHLSVFTHLWKIENHILGFTLSAQSLDKNIIENMWKVIKSHVQKKLSAINSQQDPIKSALTTWSKVH